MSAIPPISSMLYAFANPGFQAGLFLPYFQSFFGLFTLVGFVLLTYWAMHNLSKHHLRTAAVTILGTGLVGLLFTAWLMEREPRFRPQGSGARLQMMNRKFEDAEALRQWTGYPYLQSSSASSGEAAPQ